MEHKQSNALLVHHFPQTVKDLSLLRSKFNSIPYHLKSCWLFTFSDLKTIVGPCTVFAILQQLAVSSFNTAPNTSAQSFSLLQVLRVICWTWINLLPFNIDNQRRSVEEDAMNKPWRPIPAGRLTASQATILMLVLYPIAIVFGALNGAALESICLAGLGIWYNDLSGANASWIVRNFINACGITCFLSGALSVMLNGQQAGLTNSASAALILSSNPVLGQWVAIIFGIIFSGIQTQDMYDQEGDKILDRKTMPLVLGDVPTRWTIAIPVLFWSWFCPLFWSMSVIGYVVPMALGAFVAWRSLTKKTVKDDKTTSKLWNLWLVVFFTLPLQHLWLA